MALLMFVGVFIYCIWMPLIFINARMRGSDYRQLVLVAGAIFFIQGAELAVNLLACSVGIVLGM